MLIRNLPIRTPSMTEWMAEADALDLASRPELELMPTWPENRDDYMQAKSAPRDFGRRLEEMGSI